MGVSSRVPTPSSEATGAAPAASATTAARAATVLWAKMSRVVTSRPALRARLTTWMERMLSPPRAKKSSSMPTVATPRTSAKHAHSTRSRSSRAVRTGAASANAGRGRALRSSLPLAVRGMRSRTVQVAGTM